MARVKTKAPQTRLSREALVEQPPPGKLFSQTLRLQSLLVLLLTTRLFGRTEFPVLRTSMPGQMKWLLQKNTCLNLKRTLNLRCRGRFHPSCHTARYSKADLVPEKKSRPAAKARTPQLTQLARCT